MLISALINLFIMCKYNEFSINIKIKAEKFWAYYI